MQDLPQVHLIQTPTPLHRLDRISDLFQSEIWIKRDDLTGFAMGGNKGRKLEFLIADALANQSTAIVTCGSSQSNFIRQLSVACQMFGIQCYAIVMNLPYETELPNGLQLMNQGGNRYLSELSGTQFIEMDNGTWDSLFDRTAELVNELKQKGEQVYSIPVGGSSVLGAFSFYLAGKEIQSQDEPFDWIIFATSSGSTQVGLTGYYCGSKTEVLGIAVDPEPEIATDFEVISHQLHQRFPHIPNLSRDKFNIDFSFFGGGYGVYDSRVADAMDEMVKCEGIYLDPIYTGKAYLALRNLVQSKRIDGRILFWHTGGIPNIFAMPKV